MTQRAPLASGGVWSVVRCCEVRPLLAERKRILAQSSPELGATIVVSADNCNLIWNTRMLFVPPRKKLWELLQSGLL
jgi:hypothetical protein